MRCLCGEGELEHFAGGGVVGAGEGSRRVEMMAFDVAGGNVEVQSGLIEGVRGQAEVAFGDWFDSDWSGAEGRRERMEQRRGLVVGDAAEQRQIVAGLQQTEVVEDGFGRDFGLGEAEIAANGVVQGLLADSLTAEKGIEQGKVFRLNGAPVGVLGEQVVGVHADQERRVWVDLLNLFDGGFADGEILGEVDLFEGGVFADEIGGKR